MGEATNSGSTSSASANSGSTSSASADSVRAVAALSDRYWDRILELSPITATILGYPQGADRLDDPGPEGRARARTLARETIAEADRIEAGLAPGAALPTEERITLDVLRVLSELELEEQEQRVDRLKVVDPIEGPQTLLPLLATLTPLSTPEQFDAFLTRLAEYPRFMAANAELVREGLAAGLTASRIVCDRLIAQLQRLQGTPDEESPILLALPDLGERERARLIEAIAKYVRPTEAAFLDAVSGPYRAATREDPGLWSAPNGDALYATQIRFWTSLPADPAELHRIGLEELESIDEEKRAISRSLGFGDDVVAARKALRADPANIPASREEVVERARGQIDRALAAAPRYFGQLPRAACEVRPVEPFKEQDAPFAYYYAPAFDGSRPGIYFVNTYDLPSRSYVSLASTSFHEAVPGHHFQIALQAENTALDSFRQQGARDAAMAYIEGWGLYAERLADEMGLYRNPAERLGMLDGQAHRAARLVVDTGMHAFRWTREQSIDQLLKAGLTDTDARIETDRYITWPAQALTYKMGQREIERLRREATARLGSRFDLRSFHDAVLAHGALPLATLAREVPVALEAAAK